MNIAESFGLSLIFFEVIIPIILAIFGFLTWLFGNRSIESTMGALEYLITLTVYSAIPWWINPLNWVLVIAATMAIFFLTNSSNTQKVF